MELVSLPRNNNIHGVVLAGGDDEEALDDGHQPPQALDDPTRRNGTAKRSAKIGRLTMMPNPRERMPVDLPVLTS